MVIRVDNKKILLLVFFAFAIFFSILSSVNAVAVGNVTFNNNITTKFDEGTFFINWTNNSIDSSYRIFMFINSTTSNTFFYMTTNNSATAGAGVWTYGVNFTNTTQANYTFIIESVNATANANSTNISMYVDRTAPTITLPTYVNATAKKNTTDLTLNVSISDALSGLNGTVCLIDVNGTSNQTFAFVPAAHNAEGFVSSGWCNTTTLDLAGSTDGNKTLKVYVNDTVTMLNLNNSFVVLMDTTIPGASTSCSPLTVHTGDSVTCTCSGTDATSGVASETASSSPSTSNTGTFSYGCTVTDNAGNTVSASASYTVEQSTTGGTTTGGSSGSTTSTSFTYTTTIPKSSQEFSEIGTIETSSFSGGGLGVKERVKINFSGEEHYVGVREITSSKVKVEVASTPVQADMNVGEEKSFDLDDDGYYDVYVKVNEISNNKADMTIKYVHEQIPTGQATTTGTTSPTGNGSEADTGTTSTGGVTNRNLILGIVLGAVVLAVLIYFLVRKRMRK